MLKGYKVLCQTPECGRPATVKVAAEWSDGITCELKTYALCCANCTADWLEQATKKQADRPENADETLSKPKVYPLKGRAVS